MSYLCYPTSRHEYRKSLSGTYSVEYKLYKIWYYQLTKVCSCGLEYDYSLRACPGCRKVFADPPDPPAQSKKTGKASSYGLKPQFQEFAPLESPSLIFEPELLIKV